MVSDGSAPPHGIGAALPLDDYAELISGLTLIPTRAVHLTTAGLATNVRALPAEISAVLLTRIEPGRTRAVQQDVESRGGRSVVTDQDITAIALAARTLAALTHNGGRLRGSRVVLAGAGDLPMLAPILIGVGIAEITTWEQSDAAIFPLHGVVFGADIVIDLVGALPSRGANRRAGITVITRDDARSAPFAAAGLLLAALAAPGSHFDITVLCACARALSVAPVTNSSVPYIKGLALTQLVAEAATSALHTQSGRDQA